jgi:hypothetical protein
MKRSNNTTYFSSIYEEKLYLCIMVHSYKRCSIQLKALRGFSMNVYNLPTLILINCLDVFSHISVNIANPTKHVIEMF